MDWETTYQYNAGLDAGLWNDRVTLTFDAYLKRTQDLLTSVTLPYNAGAQPTNGLAQVIQNIGDVENKGIELGINSTNVQAAGDGFSWTTQFNFTLNRNRVLDIGTLRNERGELVGREILDDYSITRRGAPLGSFYGFVVAGIFQNATEISQYNELDGDASTRYQPDAAPGDLRFADLSSSRICFPGR